ncbi:hypothetical protein GCM10027168_51330 [Streptomyces capparidis]
MGVIRRPAGGPLVPGEYLSVPAAAPPVSNRSEPFRTAFAAVFSAAFPVAFPTDHSIDNRFHFC